MRRRAFLASVSALTVTGCLDSSQDETSDEDGSEPHTGQNSPDEPVPEAIETDWPMPGYDTGRTNYTPVSAGPLDRPEAVWSKDVDTRLSGPIVVDGTVYVGGEDGVVRAFDATDGTLQWNHAVDDSADTPSLVDGVLTVPTDGGIVALAPAEQTELWQEDAPNAVEVLSTTNAVYYLTDEPAVYALDREDGTERWRTRVGEPWEPYLFTDKHSVFVSTGTHSNRPWKLAPDSGRLVGEEPDSGHDFPAERFSLDGAIYAVDPFFGVVHGDEWTQDVAGAGQFAFSGGDAHVFYVTTGGDDPGLKALSRADGSVEWTAESIRETGRRPVVTTDSVLVQTSDSVTCLDVATGERRWSRSREAVGTAFVVADDSIFATGGETVRALRPP